MSNRGHKRQVLEYYKGRANVEAHISEAAEYLNLTVPQISSSVSSLVRDVPGFTKGSGSGMYMFKSGRQVDPTLRKGDMLEVIGRVSGDVWLAQDGEENLFRVTKAKVV